MKKVEVVFLCLFLLLNIVRTGDFDYLSLTDGLPNGSINDIAQDQTGTMWFATWDGLISYDGYNIDHFRPELNDTGSLPNNKTRIVHPDKSGRIWVVTDKEVCRYHPEYDYFEVFEIKEYDNPDFGLIRLVEYKHYIILHTTRGLFFYDDNSANEFFSPLRIEDINHRDIEYVSLVKIRNNNILLVPAGESELSPRLLIGSLFIDGDKPPIVKITSQIICKQRINDVETLKGDRGYYIGSSEGLEYFSPEKGFTKVMNGIYIYNITYTSNHNLWITSKKPGLINLKLHTGETVHYKHDPNTKNSLLSNIVYSLFEDFSNNLWIGHGGQGLSILNLHKKKFKTYRNNPYNTKSLSNNSVFCFAEGYEKILVGTRFDGINVMQKNKQTGEYEFEKIDLPGHFVLPEEHIAVWHILKKSDWEFWVGSNAGLLKIVDYYGEWKIYQVCTHQEVGTVRKIFIDPNDNLLLGTFLGLYVAIPTEGYKLKLFKYLHDNNDPGSIGNNVITEIFLDSSDKLWIGTYQGLNVLITPYSHLNLSGNIRPRLEFKHYYARKQNHNTLNNNEINCIYEYQQDEIWIGTQGGGINIFNNSTGTFKYITIEDGLPGEDVFGILSDNHGKLWISTNRGLSSLVYKNEKPQITTFNYKDGIQGDFFTINAFLKASDGKMYFGGRNGFTTFYPGKIKLNKIPPRVKLTKFIYHNDEIHPGDTLGNRVILKKKINHLDTIILPYHANRFGIGVAALHFQDTENNVVSYTVDNLYSEWRHRKISNYDIIRFNELEAGNTYTLRFRAISSDNIPSENEKKLTVVIKPPWWGTWLFKITMIVFILILIGILIQSIINKQGYIYQQKINQIELENKESKLRYLTNISHELRTPLSLIVAPIEHLLTNGNLSKENLRNHLYHIFRNSQVLMRLINQIIDFSKLNEGKLKLHAEKININEFIHEVVDNFKIYKDQRNTQISLKLTETPLILWGDVQKVEEIFYNLLSNAFKHLSENGNIEISAALSPPPPEMVTLNGDQFIKISVFNEGKEIPEDKIHKIFDRFYQATSSEDGAGIGLTFTKSLVELHRGIIKVENIYQKGVMFNLYFHTGNTHLNEDEIIYSEKDAGYRFADNVMLSEKEIQEQIDSNLASNEKLKIVVVEDNKELRSFFRKVLSGSYQFYGSGNGEEGLKLIRKTIPDVIICDVMMPGMNGYDLTNAVKNNLKTCHIPVLLLTAKSTSQDRQFGFTSGADAYVIKPFNLNVLLTQLDRLIKNRELIRDKYRKQNFMIEYDNNITSNKDDMFIKNVNEIIEKNLLDPDFSVSSLSSELNLSSTQTYRKIKALTGYNTVEFIRVIRLNRAAETLRTTRLSIKEVCYKSGFVNFSYFVKCFREYFNMTPTEFRENKKGKPFDNVSIIKKIKKRREKDKQM